MAKLPSASSMRPFNLFFAAHGHIIFNVYVNVLNNPIFSLWSGKDETKNYAPKKLLLGQITRRLVKIYFQILPYKKKSKSVPCLFSAYVASRQSGMWTPNIPIIEPGSNVSNTIDYFYNFSGWGRKSIRRPWGYPTQRVSQRGFQSRFRYSGIKCHLLLSFELFKILAKHLLQVFGY